MDKQFSIIMAFLIIIAGLNIYSVLDFAAQAPSEIDEYWYDCPKALDTHLRDIGYVYSSSYVADCQMHEALVEAGIMEEVKEDVNSSGN